MFIVECEEAGGLRTVHGSPLSIDGLTLHNLGAKDSHDIVHGQVWRLVSCIFLHGGLLHITMNMLVQIWLGMGLEKEHGCFTIGWMYLLCGVTGSMLSTLCATDVESVGASGAIMGLAGISASKLLYRWIVNPRSISSSDVFSGLFLGLFVLSNLVVLGTDAHTCLALILCCVQMGWTSDHVDNYAHLGGLVAGGMLGSSLVLEPNDAASAGISINAANSALSRCLQSDVFQTKNVPVALLVILDVVMIYLIWGVLNV